MHFGPNVNDFVSGSMDSDSRVDWRAASNEQESIVMQRKENVMKVTKARVLLSAATLALLTGSSVMAMSDDLVRWEAFVGNIRTGAAGAVGSGTGAVNAAGAPWVATGGKAHVNLATGQLHFKISGLVLADTSAVGTQRITLRS